MEFDSVMPRVMSPSYFQSLNQFAKKSGYDGYLLCYFWTKAIVLWVVSGFLFLFLFFFSFLIWFPKKQDLCDCALCLCLYLTTFAWRAVFYQLSMIGRNLFQVYEKRWVNKVLLLRRRWPAASLELYSPWRVHFGCHPGGKGRHGSCVSHPLAHITATEPLPAALWCSEDQGNDLWFTLAPCAVQQQGCKELGHPR